MSSGEAVGVWAQTVVTALAAGVLGGAWFFHVLKSQTDGGGYRHGGYVGGPAPRHQDDDSSWTHIRKPPRRQNSSMSGGGGSPTADTDENSFKSRGWSMQDAMALAERSKNKAKAASCTEVLHSLQKGNSRFWTGKATRPEVSAFERRVLISTQFPSSAILGCSDSRVPVEIVFDQGLGDMFVIRVAGNCLGPTTAASLEYAVHHLNVKVLLVMGHEGCGAIKAAGLPKEIIDQEPESLASVLKDIKQGINEENLTGIQDVRARDREAVTSNVRRQVERVCMDASILAKVKAQKLIIVGAFYEISSGIVDFFHEVVNNGPKDDRKPSPGVRSRYFPETGKVVSE